VRLFETLLTQLGIQSIAKPKRNMKNKLMSLMDKLLTRKPSIIETIVDQLNNISQIEHSRHRSQVNCLVSIVFGLIAYYHQPKNLRSISISSFCLRLNPNSG
jgi:Transposase DDE domain